MTSTYGIRTAANRVFKDGPASSPDQVNKRDVRSDFAQAIDDAFDDVDRRIVETEAVAATGIRIAKQTVRLLTTSNVDMTALKDGDTFDGVVVATGDRVAKAYNGLTGDATNGGYDVGASSSARSSDMDTDTEIVGSTFTVEAGTHATETWSCQNKLPVTVGTTPLAFKKSNVANPTTAEVLALRNGDASVSDRINPVIAALQDTVVYGCLDTLTTGTDIANAMFTYANESGEDLQLRLYECYAKAAGTVYINRMSVDEEGEETKIAGYAISIPGSGPQSVAKADYNSIIPLLAGEYLNVFGYGVLFVVSSKSGSNGGYYNSASGSGNTTGFTRGALQTGIEIMNRLTFEKLAVDLTTINAISTTAEKTATQVEALRGAISNTRTQRIGVKGTPAVGAAPGSSETIVWLTRAIAKGRAKTFSCYSDGSGLCQFRVFSWATDNSIVKRYEKLLALSTGLNPPMTVDLPVDVDDTFGYFARKLIHVNERTTNGGAYGHAAGNLDRLSGASLVGTVNPEAYVEIEYEHPGLLGAGGVPMPGDPLRFCDLVSPVAVSILEAAGESTTRGTGATAYLKTASDYDNVEMFAQGLRAANADSPLVVSMAAVSQNGGTATKVDAEERASNSGNSYAYDNLADDVTRGNTGMLTLADRISKLGYVEAGVPLAAERKFIMCTGHDGYTVNQYHSDAIWWQLGYELHRDAKALYDDEGVAAKCTGIFLGLGPNNAYQGSFIRTGYEVIPENIVGLDESTKEEFKDQIKAYLYEMTASRRSRWGMGDQMPFIMLQPSLDIRGNGAYTSQPRRGMVQQCLVEIDREVSFFYLLTPDFACARAADKVHKESAGYDLEKLIMARAYHQIVRRGMTPEYVRAMGTVLVGTTQVRQFYWSPYPLVPDTSVAAMTNYGISVTLDDSDTPETLTGDPVIVNSGYQHPYIRSVTAELGSSVGGSTAYFHTGMHYGRSGGSGGYDNEAMHNIRMDYTESETVNGSLLTAKWWAPHQTGEAIPY